MKSKKKLRVICTILFCFALIGLLSWLIWSELHHSRPIIRNINAVTRISGTYVCAEDDINVCLGFPFEAEMEEALLAFLAGQEMHLVQRRHGRNTGIGFPQFTSVGIQIVYAIPRELVTIRIERELGLVETRFGQYEIPNSAAVFEELLEILGLDEIQPPAPNALVPSVRINDAMFSPVWNVPVSIDNILIDDLVDGWITSVVRISEWPMENNQGNLTLFLDAPYKFYNDGVILFIDGEWNFFEYRDDFDFLE